MLIKLIGTGRSDLPPTEVNSIVTEYPRMGDSGMTGQVMLFDVR